MRLDDVRGLKQQLLASMTAAITPSSSTSVLAASARMARSFGALRERPQAASHALSAIALGAVSKSRTSSKLAIRLQRKSADVLAVVDQICLLAKNEVDVRYVGRISSLAKKGATADATQVCVLSKAPPPAPNRFVGQRYPTRIRERGNARLLCARPSRQLDSHSVQQSRPRR